MGFWEDVTQWMWNHLILMKALGVVTGCFQAGGLGLLFDDDDGAMMLWCYNFFGNAGTVTFPAYYLSSYAEES
jgi:hypothetical protein